MEPVLKVGVVQYFTKSLVVCMMREGRRLNGVIKDMASQCSVKDTKRWEHALRGIFRARYVGCFYAARHGHRTFDMHPGNFAMFEDGSVRMIDYAGGSYHADAGPRRGAWLRSYLQRRPLGFAVRDVGLLGTGWKTLNEKSVKGNQGEASPLP